MQRRIEQTKNIYVMDALSRHVPHEGSTPMAILTQRLIHPDAIPSFWEELVKELRRDRWRLPVIMRRH